MFLSYVAMVTSVYSLNNEIIHFVEYVHLQGSQTRFVFGAASLFRLVHPDTGISQKGMAIMNCFIEDVFSRLSGEAREIAKY